MNSACRMPDSSSVKIQDYAIKLENVFSIFLHLLVGCPMVSLVAVMVASLDEAIRHRKIDGMGSDLQ